MIDFNKEAEEQLHDVETSEPVVENGSEFNDDQSQVPVLETDADDIDSTADLVSLDGSSRPVLSQDDAALQTAPIDNLEEDMSKKSVLDQSLAYSKAFQRFVAENGQVFVGYKFNRRFETHPVEATFIKRFLTKRYFDDTRKALSKSKFKEWSEIYSINAVIEVEQSQVHTRVAKIDDAYYLDTADADGHIVRIGADGWTILDDPTLPFFRPYSMLPIVLPDGGGSIDDLREFTNISDDDFKMLIAFIIECFRPDTPKPILYINGEPGSSKTTLLKIIMALVDPSLQSVVSLPKSQRDLLIFARNARLLPFDNLSTITSQMSDALCGIATGAGMRTRKLYTDTEEIIFNARRPVILSGIDDFITRQDLLDRCIMIKTLPMAPDERRDERSFWLDFDNKKSQILGALLTAFSEALSCYDSVSESVNTRMKEFALLGVALEQSDSVGWDEGAFQQALRDNRRNAIESLLEDDLIADYIREYKATNGSWSGNNKQLLKQIITKYPNVNDLPQSAKGLSNHLRKIAGFLREIGVNVTMPNGVDWQPGVSSIREVKFC